jgi:hypothetical protein
MTTKQPSSFFGVLVGLGAVASVVTASLQPTVFAPTLAASGGFLYGVSILSEKKRNKEKEIAEATNVSSNFSRLYEINKGIISAEQLAINTNVDIERINNFLKELIVEQNGQVITTNKGVVYSFPHPANALNELSQNAKNWALAQQEQLLHQINVLQQQTALVVAQQATMKVPVQPVGTQQQILNNNENIKTNVDLWNNLL